MFDAVKKRRILLGASLGGRDAGARRRAGAGAGARSSATPPSNTSPPTISGTAQKGQRLHAEPGSWSGTSPIRFAYRWQRCSSSGTNCSNISGATDNDYTLTSADVGRTVRVVVTASNSAGVEHGRVLAVRSHRGRPGAGRDRVAHDLGGGTARRGSHRQPGHLDGAGSDHVHLPVGALRPVRRQVRVRHRRPQPDVHAHLGRRRPRDARSGAGEEPVRPDVRYLDAHGGGLRDRERLPDRGQGRLDRPDGPARAAARRRGPVRPARAEAELAGACRTLPRLQDARAEPCRVRSSTPTPSRTTRSRRRPRCRPTRPGGRRSCSTCARATRSASSQQLLALFVRARRAARTRWPGSRPAAWSPSAS